MVVDDWVVGTGVLDSMLLLFALRLVCCLSVSFCNNSPPYKKVQQWRPVNKQRGQSSLGHNVALHFGK